MNTHNFDSLKGKIAVVTGGYGVLGYAICEALAASGVKTAILGRNEEKAQNAAKKLKDQYNTQCIGVKADVVDKASLVAAKKQINDTLGSVDFLLNGAGGNSPKATTKVETMDENSINELEKTFFGLEMEGFDDVFSLNFTGTLLPSMIFGEDMLKKKYGVILNISSMNSFKPLTKIPAYSAAKAAINNFTLWLSVHMAKTGIRVNAIAPGFFLTDQNRFLLTDEKTGAPTPRGQKIISNTPMGKYGEPEDLQGATLFLLSDMSAFINGIVVPVDGGYSAFGGV